MAQLNVTAAGSVSSHNTQEIESLQCRVENTLKSALYYLSSGASQKSIDDALERVHRASQLLMRAQDHCRSIEPMLQAA